MARTDFFLQDVNILMRLRLFTSESITLRNKGSRVNSNLKSYQLLTLMLPYWALKRQHTIISQENRKMAINFQPPHQWIKYSESWDFVEFGTCTFSQVCPMTVHSQGKKNTEKILLDNGICSKLTFEFTGMTVSSIFRSCLTDRLPRKLKPVACGFHGLASFH